ncbi:LysR family transcriptional regulator [Hoeflea ulvae]|uniref:LysR family transcriptional regulator n=1 Tax=Hoeflea ulvae TaxID=2983764 RepID=A0ABT3YKS4_9HYPH|nr:LysR family transcriptional regulator [Hoeflea ulvae]MCY0096438.1 LysR family transcriptional regulator [Hoeflea ulvae]
MLNSGWLDTFTTLCETGHFTRTAELRGMTQPGVSQHLRKLEDQVGHPLISRQGKGFSLTPAGEAVLAVGRLRRREEQSLMQSVSHDAPDIGEVSIGCSGSFAMLLYPGLLPLMQAAPKLTVRLEAMPRDGIIAAVLDRRLDLGIVGHRPDHPRLEATRLGVEELCLLLPAGEVPGDLSLADLDARGFIAHPDGFAYADDLFALNFPDEFRGADRLRVRAFVNQISQIPAPVAHGIGYTLLPRSGYDAYPQRDRLQIVGLPQGRSHELWLISGKGRQWPARIPPVARVIRQIAERLCSTSDAGT